MNRILFLAAFLLVVILTGCTKTDEDNPVTPEATPPEAPTGLIADGSSDRSISLGWNDNSDDEEYFYVERSLGSTGAFMQIATLGANVTSFSDTELAPGVTYAYRVRTGNSTGFSEYSNEVSAQATGFVENPELLIAEYNEFTPTRDVTLLIIASDAESMMLSNSDRFQGAEWEPFKPLKSWQLATGADLKTVYLKIANDFGDTSEVITTSIMPEMPSVDAVINSGEESTSTIQVRMTLVVEGGITGMKVYNDIPDSASEPFDWSDLEEEFNWNLITGPGTKTVRVKVRNDFLVEATATASIEPEIPEVSFEINGGVNETASRYVTLDLSSTGGATEMKISNSPLAGSMIYGSQVDPRQGKWDKHWNDSGLSHKNNKILNGGIKGDLRSGADLRVRDKGKSDKSMSSAKNFSPAQPMARTEARPTSSSKLYITGSNSVNNSSIELDENDEWIPYTETVDWELDCGDEGKTVYVLVRNDFLIETSVDESIEPLPPTDPFIQILDGDQQNSYIVDLAIHCDYADLMMISHLPGFAGAEWIEYEENITGFDLGGGRLATGGSSQKSPYEEKPSPSSEIDEIVSVYVKFINNFEIESDVASDNIEIDAAPRSLGLSYSRNEINPEGSGGNTTTQLTATVLTSNENPVGDGKEVYFLMGIFPGGQDENPRINESDGTEPGNFYHSPFDSAQTIDGSAVVTIHAGSGLGLIGIRVWTFIDEETRGTPDADSIVVIINNLSVTGGPPHHVDIDINEIAEDGGGAIWILEVSATVRDIQNHPVLDSIAVQFEVDQDIAVISDGYTGNENMAGITVPGVAFSTLVYNSSVTNDSIQIQAEVLAGDGHNTITGIYNDFKLPLQEGAGLLYSDPLNWNYRNQHPIAVFDMSVFVYDGHDHCIDKQLVRFLTDRGLYYTSAAGGAVRNEALTGPLDYPVGMDGDECGWAQRYLRITFDDAFPDPRILDSRATANVEIIGCADIYIEPVTINLIH
ncbi:MAG: fibronectin type III domain-containing protein [Candidatus Electryonea clarkiae]|nr:fibronectin type III domain-containing protein [Candidatus Electryonea clarkiae]MDP8286822.1 fibronectin type III domain-containing protein [Candidatus Electryonea clarkiae]